jgi:hypothetical protein
MREALMLEINARKAWRKLAKAMVDKIEAGDVAAFREVRDMTDGKVPQAITGEDGGPLEIRATVEHVSAIQKT